MVQFLVCPLPQEAATRNLARKLCFCLFFHVKSANQAVPLPVSSTSVDMSVCMSLACVRQGQGQGQGQVDIGVRTG